MNLTLTPRELTATTEAIYDCLLDRVRWTVFRGERNTPFGWDSLDYEIVKVIIEDLAGAYTKAMMEVMNISDLDPEYPATFRIRPAFWELVDELLQAPGWEEAPTHGRHSNCDVCFQLRVA